MRKKCRFLRSFLFIVSSFNAQAMTTDNKQNYLDLCLFSSVIYGQNLEALRWLSEGANPNYTEEERNYYSEGRRNSLDFIIKSGDIALLETALTHKADPDKCLIKAIYQRAPKELIELCIKHGADVKKGIFLTAAVGMNDLELVKFLLQYQPAINYESIALAIREKNAPILDLLIKNGANIYVRDNLGMPVFFTAYYKFELGFGSNFANAEFRCKEIITVLEYHGVDRNFLCYRGGSLDQWEERRGNGRGVSYPSNDDLFPTPFLPAL